MAQVSLAEAKAKFSSLINRVMQGETVEVTRRGRPVVMIVASDPKPEPFDVAALRKLHAGYTKPPVDSETWWREYRDGERY